MGMIHVYDTASAEHKTVRASGRLKDIFPDYDFSRAALVKAGERIPPDYEVQDDDVIFIRTAPSSMAVMLVVGIVVAVVAAGAAIGVSVYATRQAKKAQEEAEQAQRDAENLARKVNQLPFLRGAKNRSAIGNAVQYVMGNAYNTPYMLTDGFYTTAGADGEKQYWNAVLSCGFGKQAIQSMSIGSVRVKSWSGGDAQSGVYDFDAGVFHDAANKIEIVQGGDFAMTEFNQKICSKLYGTEIKHEYGKAMEPLIITLEPCVQRAQICVQFNGLRYFEEHNWHERAVTINLFWSNDNGSSWHPFAFDFGGNTIKRNSNRTLRFTATREFSAAESYGKDVQIKLERQNPKMESNSHESAYLMFAQSWCYDNEKSSASTLVPCAIVEKPLKEKLTLMAVRMIANDSTKDLLDEINVMSQALARTWDGSAWSVEKKPTRNPAAWLLEILTSGVHGHSKYEDAEINLASFGRLHELCEREGFYTDGIVTQGIKKRDLCSKLLTAVGADMIVGRDGKLEVAIDNAVDAPVALLNTQCIKSIKVAKSFERKADGMKLTFTDRSTWQPSARYAMLDGGSKGSEDIVTERALEYVTDSEHVYKVGQRLLRQQQLQPREITVELGREGDFYPLYSTVLLQVPQLRQGVRSSVIKSVVKSYGLITGFELADWVDFDPSKSYGAVVHAMDTTGRRLIYVKIEGEGRTRSVRVLTQISALAGVLPQEGNVISVGLLDADGEFSKVTEQMKITGIAPSENGWSLTLRDYNPAIYEYGAIPEYKSNITSPAQPQGNVPTEYVKPSELIEAAADAAQEAADVVAHGVHFTNVHRIRDLEACLDEIVAKIDSDNKAQSASISISESEILLRVGDMERELVGMLSVQAGAVQALVQGGGAQGRLGVSLELPAMIEAATFARFVKVCGKAETEAVYAKVDRHEYWSIRGDATEAAIKKLWDKAVKAGLLASQIDLSATQINVAAEHVVITGDTNKGQTIIEGGKIRTALIEVEKLLAQSITIKSGGSLQSEDYKAGSAGWKIASDGNVEFSNGAFRGTIYATSGTLDRVYVNGFYTSNNTPFQPMAMINLGYNNGAVQLQNNKNVQSVLRVEKGAYTITLKKSVKLKTHYYNGNKYIDVFAIGNAADTFNAGFKNMLLMTPNWLRQYVDGRLAVDNNGYATVSYVTLYFTDNNSDQLIDPLSAQCFIFGTETD